MENSFISSTVKGVKLQGTILRLERFQVVFEIYPSGPVPPRVSEVLKDLEIVIDGKPVYSGRAVVTNLLPTGNLIACEAKLDDPGVKIGIHAHNNGHSTALEAYNVFFGKWQQQAKIQPGFRLAVSDLQSYLWELKLLLEQLALSTSVQSSRDQSEMMLRISQDLAAPVLSSIDAMHERFEEAAQQVSPEFRGAHEALVRRQLHPMFLCAPFGHRTYHKPSGIAGDYEIMNMIHRNTFEGESLYAKMVHFWLVSQWAAKSVRNRIAYIKTKLTEEVARAAREKRKSRVLNLGCGPARELQDFMAEHSLADCAEITVVDFDAEALDYATAKLHEAKTRHGRRTNVQTRLLSVAQILKDSVQPERNSFGGDFDLIYCGGLFDYFPDRTCRQLISLLYSRLAPGGLLVAANMDDRQKPFRYMLEYLLDWHLIYRDARCMSSFVPNDVPSNSWSVVSESLAINLFLEMRKPKEIE